MSDFERKMFHMGWFALGVITLSLVGKGIYALITLPPAPPSPPSPCVDSSTVEELYLQGNQYVIKDCAPGATLSTEVGPIEINEYSRYPFHTVTVKCTCNVVKPINTNTNE